MNLDEIDLTGVPDRVVRAARRAAQPWTQVWVVTRGEATGILLDNATGVVSIFEDGVVNLPWTELSLSVPVEGAELDLHHASGETYTYQFRDSDQRDALLARWEETANLRRDVREAGPRAGGQDDEASRARAALVSLSVLGLFLTLIGLIVVAGVEQAGSRPSWFGLVLLGIGQVGVAIGVVGCGVLLGIRASR